MKNFSRIVAGMAGLMVLTLTAPALAEDNKDAQTTITGEAKCAMCALKESAQCQTVIQTQADGKTVTYYLADNEAAKDFHHSVCKETKKVVATGTVKEADGKRTFTATKITQATQ
jgi:hypothetical protein